MGNQEEPAHSPVVYQTAYDRAKVEDRVRLPAGGPERQWPGTSDEWLVTNGLRPLSCSYWPLLWRTNRTGAPGPPRKRIAP